MISVFRSGASPHSTDAPVNATVQIRKKRLRPRTLASQPVAGRITALAARYEVSTHEISSTPAESEPCMWGSATLMTVTSSTCITVTVMTVAVIAQRRTAPICGSDSAAAVPASSGAHRAAGSRDALTWDRRPSGTPGSARRGAP